jgi:2-C-methyl-D-erythritol 4-phosphate cytidylyltransferase
MVEWSIQAFRAAASVRSIVVACPPGHVHDLACGEIGAVDGGTTRAESVRNALQAVDTELVAIHDAARPLVSPGLIEEVVGTLVADPEAAGAIAATPVTDTVKLVGHRVAEGTKSALTPQEGANADFMVESTLDRGRLWAAQTPQIFRVDALRSALGSDSDNIAATATDESMLIEAAGGKVLIYPSSPGNLKITTPLDLKLAELLLAERSTQ